MPPPNSVRGFIGAMSWYRRYVPNFSKIAETLIGLTRKHARFKWTPECQAVSEFLKESLTVIPLLAYPDTNLPYELYTDASANCIGAVLSQEQEDIDEDGTDEMVENLFPVTYTESYSMSVFGY